ncbi:MAG TPA: glycosyltransferase [Anaerolineales bacterium]|nr:glycosyltransferase [Anaerolineales bacterium]
MKPIVSVVLGSYNRRTFLKATLESIRANGMDFGYEIIVVDGGSTDGSLKLLAAQKDVITIIQHNRGEFRGNKIQPRSWGYFMNLGFKAAQGKYILMISDDCLLIPGAVKNGVERFEKMLLEGQKIGAMAFYWRNWPEQKSYRVGLTLGDKLFVNHGLYFRSAVEEVGWLDESRYHFYHADGDICLRLWEKGFEVIDSPVSFVEHFVHANRKIRAENRILQQNDWRAYLERWTDIYYDPATDNIGGWLYRDYIDPMQTAKSFPFFARLMVRLNPLLRRVRNRYFKPVTKARCKYDKAS